MQLWYTVEADTATSEALPLFLQPLDATIKLAIAISPSRHPGHPQRRSYPDQARRYARKP